jgi:hypothetical protein
MADYKVELHFQTCDGKDCIKETSSLQSNDWRTKKETVVKLNLGEEILKALASMCISNWLRNQKNSLKLSEISDELVSVKLLKTEQGNDYLVKEWTGTDFKS